MEPYMVASAVFGLGMALFTTRELLQKKIRSAQYVFWMSLWLGLILIGVVPQFYSAILLITSVLGMYTPIHFVTTFSILILFTVVYLLAKRVSELNEKIGLLVQKIAVQSINGKADRLKEKEA
mgnify:CR=1 FL=1